MTAAPVVDQGPVGPDHPEHPDHYLFAQIREAVAVLDAELDKPTDEASVRMAARLLPLAKQHGFDQVDYVVLSRHVGEVGENVFLVRGELADPRICVRTSPPRKRWRPRWRHRWRNWMTSTAD